MDELYKDIIRRLRRAFALAICASALQTLIIIGLIYLLAK